MLVTANSDPLRPLAHYNSRAKLVFLRRGSVATQHYQQSHNFSYSSSSAHLATPPLCQHCRSSRLLEPTKNPASHPPNPSTTLHTSPPHTTSSHTPPDPRLTRPRRLRTRRVGRRCSDRRRRPTRTGRRMPRSAAEAQAAAVGSRRTAAVAQRSRRPGARTREADCRSAGLAQPPALAPSPPPAGRPQPQPHRRQCHRPLGGHSSTPFPARRRPVQRRRVNLAAASTGLAPAESPAIC